jgi:isoleucyl-tRNA synthetase
MSVGRTYRPLFPYFADAQVIADLRGAADSTGVVHVAPGFGEDDLQVAQSRHSARYAGGCCWPFTNGVTDYAGLNVIEANAATSGSEGARVVVRHEQYRHNYLHCWRTDTPLIYKAVNPGMSGGRFRAGWEPHKWRR